MDCTSSRETAFDDILSTLERTAEELPPAPLLISSPYDPDARYGKKRQSEWTGYKVHITETVRRVTRQGSPPQAELTRKEVNGSPSRPDMET